MNLKRLIGGIAVAGAVGASTLGLGAGIANAGPDSSSSATALVQQAGWHGYGNGYGHGYGHDYGHDYGHGGYFGGWHGGGPFWNPWAWGWHR
jgi:hypothetical protein